MSAKSLLRKLTLCQQCKLRYVLPALTLLLVVPAGIALALAYWDVLFAQTTPTFGSGSSGDDGALDLTAPQFAGRTLDFFLDKDEIFSHSSNPELVDPEGDGIYHFTYITIPAEVTLRLFGENIPPTYWLSQGDVQIDGVVDLNGGNGHDSCNRITDRSCWTTRKLSVPGAGGYAGGFGGNQLSPALTGEGPIGGGRGRLCGGGGLGSRFASPLMGGSGGAGEQRSDGDTVFGVGGGAGGGAILVASSSSISLEGKIQANGGDAGQVAPGSWCAGGGAGGIVRLAAPALTGAGIITVNGGKGDCCFTGAAGDQGVIRLEGFQDTINGSLTGAVFRSVPFDAHLPVQNVLPKPEIKVVSVDGKPVPQNPTGDLNSPDVFLDTDQGVLVEIEARNITPPAIIKLHVGWEESTQGQVFLSTPLVGDFQFSTATVSIPAIARGFSQMFLEADWDPIAVKWVKEVQGTVNLTPQTIVTLPDGRLRGYYHQDGTILSAISTDGLNWTTEPGVRLSPGGPDDSDVIHEPEVVPFPDGTFRMYYQGRNCCTWVILSAFSTDGLNWTKESGIRIHPNMVFPPAPHPRGKHVSQPEVVRLSDGRFRMYLGGSKHECCGSVSLHSAVSRDGINWTVEPGIRLDPPRNPNHNRDSKIFQIYLQPVIQEHSDRLRMYFTEYARSRSSGSFETFVIKSATSVDGLTWKEDPWSWTRVETGPAGSPDSVQVDLGDIIEMPDGVVRMYYSGSDGTNSTALSAVQVPLP